MPRIQLRPRSAGQFPRALLIAGFLALSGFAGQAQSPTTPDPAPPAAATGRGHTEHGTATVPSAPPGISITPPTQPMFRPPSRRDPDSTPPVEGCPAGDSRKLELLV